MESTVDNKENEARGCLSLNDKIYPVYDGHNVVGRNPDAVINIKNLNVSKYHAVLTVLPENTHYLSDFKSSNGTLLNNVKLTPLQLYQLNDGASIKFGDVFCTYKILGAGKNIRGSLEDTQNFSESFYTAGTQEVHSLNLPEGINFNEMPTQIFTAKDLSVNEMPTQLYDILGPEESSNYSVDYMTMQKASESQNANGILLNFMDNRDEGLRTKTDDEVQDKSTEISSTSKKIVDSDTDLIPQIYPEHNRQASCLSQINPVCIGSDRKILGSDTDEDETPQMRPEQSGAACLSQINPVSVGSSRKILDSDTDEDLEPQISPEHCEQTSQMNTSNVSQGSDKNNSSSSSQIRPVLTSTSRSILDSDTDEELTLEGADPKSVEDNLIKNKSQASVKSNSSQISSTSKKETSSEQDSDTEEYDPSDRSKSKYYISEDSETDIELEAEKKAVEKSVENLKLSESQEPMSNTQKIKISKKNVSEDHPYCGEINQNTQTLNNVGASTSRIDINAENNPSQEEQQIPTSDVCNIGPTVEEKKSQSQLEVDVISDEKRCQSQSEQQNPTSDICLSKEDEKERSVAPEADDKDEENEDTQIFDVASQEIEFDFVKNKEINPETAANLNSGQENHPKIDDIFLQPTQTCDVPESHKSKNLPEKEPTQPDNGKAQSDQNDDIFLLPTQTLETTPQVDAGNLSAKNSEQMDEIFLQPTQALESICGPATAETNGNPQDDEALANTQTLEMILDDSEKSVSKDSLYSSNHSTPIAKKAVQEALKSLIDDDDDDFLSPTQQPSTSKKDDIFSRFKMPSPLQTPKKKREAKEEEFFQPTQALEALHDDGTHFAKVEDELHEIFASQSVLCTQQLVDVLNTTEDVIDDSIIQEEPVRISKSEVLTADSVKKLLEEDAESQVVELKRHFEDQEVKTYSRRSKVANKSQEEDDSLKKSEDNTSQFRKSGRKQIEVRNEVVESDKEKSEKNNNQNKEKQNDGSDSNQKNVHQTRGRQKKNEEEDPQPSTSSNRAGRRGRKDVSTLNDEETKKQNIDKQPEIVESDVESTGKPRFTRRKKLSVQEDVSEAKTPKVNSQEKQDIEVQDNSDNSQENKRISKRKQNTPLEVEASGSGLSKTKNEDLEKVKPQRRERTKTEDEEQKSEVKSELQNTRSTRHKQNLLVQEEISNESGSCGTRSKSKSKTKENPRTVLKRIRTDVEDQKTENIKTDSQSSEDDKRTSRRQQNLPVEAEVSSASGKTRNKSRALKEQDTNKKGTTTETEEEKPENLKSDSQSSDKTQDDKRFSRRKQNLPVEEEPSTSAKNKSQEQSPKEILSKTRRNKTATKEKEINIVSEQPQENKRSSRRQKLSVESDKTPSLSEGLVRIDLPQSSKSVAKRKKDQNDEPLSTPVKKRTTGSNKTQKRSHGSEDDFTDDVASPPKVRKLGRRTKGGDESDTNSETPSVGEANKQRRLSANSRRQKREADDEQPTSTNQRAGKATPSLATPDRSRRVLKPKVVFTMMDNPSLESAIRQLGGSVVDSVDACTVLVTPSVKRSQKLLCAVAQGKPICSSQWIQACKKAFTFLDPWDFILEDKEAEKKWNFSLKVSLERALEKKLLEGHTFQLIVDNAADVLKGAIEACGGKCVTRNLAKTESRGLIIVSSDKNKSKYEKICKQNKKIKVVEAEAIFDGTLRQEFRFDQFLLSK